MSDITLGLLLAAAGFLWLASLLTVRWWTRRQMLEELYTAANDSDDLSLPAGEVRPEDHQALTIVRTYRRQALLKLWPERDVSFKAILDLSLDLIQQIAAVYHPEAQRPELQASLAELINLQARIGARLQGLLATLPLRAFKDLKLQTVLYCHDLYQLCRTHPLYRFLRQYHLDKIGRWAWMVKNLANPWYWGRRAAYSGGKELLLRFFWARVITIVGVEAIRLYSGRAPVAAARRSYELLWQELSHLQSLAPAQAGAAEKFFLRLVLGSRDLSDADRLLLLARLTEPPPQSAGEPPGTTPPERRQVERWLRQFVRGAVSPAAQRALMTAVRQRLAALPAAARADSGKRSEGR